MHTTLATPLPAAPPVVDGTHVFDPARWRDTRWVGQAGGNATSRRLLAGAATPADEERAVRRAYALACADLAEATLGAARPDQVQWDAWADQLRAVADRLAPAASDAPIVARALHHGTRLEGDRAPWAHRLRRGFTALLAAHLPTPGPAIIGEGLARFRAADTAWLARPAATPALDGNEGRSAEPLPQVPPETRRWPTDRLRPNPLYPRVPAGASAIEELAASIRAQGVLQPLLVTPDGTVVAGHRRLAAARHVGLAEVPVIPRELSRMEQLELLLVENLQRQDLSPVEEARGYRALLAEGSLLAAIARAVGVTATRITSRLELLDLDPQVQERIHRGELPVGVAPVLLPLRDLTQQRRLATLAVRKRLTVARLRRLVNEALLVLGPQQAKELPADDEPSGGGLSATRQATLDALRARAACTLTFGDLAETAERTCCACGMASLAQVCAACPLADLLHALLTRTESHAG